MDHMSLVACEEAQTLHNKSLVFSFIFAPIGFVYLFLIYIL